MVDVSFHEIHEKDSIVFIRNERGKKPLLLYGTVDLVNANSIIARKKNGDFYRVCRPRRDPEDERMLSVMVIHDRPESTGRFFDCTNYPVNIGDSVTFMEYPSQGFSTSLLVGKVINLAPGEVTILVESPTYRKYMRKPDELAVIGCSSIL